MDWSTFGTLIAQGFLAFLVVLWGYSTARTQIRKEREKDAKARQAALPEVSQQIASTMRHRPGKP